MSRLVHAVPIGLLALCATAASAQETDELEGTNWRLEILAGEPAAEDVETTLAFREGGEIGGNGGCNSYGGTLSFDGETQIAATRMACPEPAMGQENAFFTALSSAASYELDGDTLALLGADGAPLATFSAAD